MSTKKITLVLSILLAILFGNNIVQSQQKGNLKKGNPSTKVQLKTTEDVTATVDCKSLGTLNGEVSYQYDVTLKNNTSNKLIVKYKVIFKAGDVIKTQHSHSTILIPGEELTETNDGTMKEADWDLVTKCWVDWTATVQ